MENSDDHHAVIIEPIEDDVLPVLNSAVPFSNAIAFAAYLGIAGDPFETSLQVVEIANSLIKSPLV